jgi:hypothetical protein
MNRFDTKIENSKISYSTLPLPAYTGISPSKNTKHNGAFFTPKRSSTNYDPRDDLRRGM